MKHLPGGRGRQRGPDARASEQEFFDTRAQLVDETGGWYISNAPLPFQSQSSTTYTANQARFGLCLPIFASAELVECRVRPTTNVANSTATAALYRYESSPQPRLIQMPNTLCTFNTATAGVKTATLRQPAQIQAGGIYFVGLYCDRGTAFTSPNIPIAGSLLMSSQTTCPPIVAINSITKTTTAFAPLVAYFSREAIKVL